MSDRNYTAVPLRREHMPRDDRISLKRYTRRGTASETRIPDDKGPQQALEGFEATYRNIIDYIVRITYRIWEDRDVEYIRDCYAPSSRVFDDYGLQLGNEKIVSDTHHTTGAFSDIELIADEVIWAGDDRTGFHTSHRTLIRGTNDGPSRYGPATGRSIDVLVIANCVALNNDIFLEHVLYNNSEMLLQLGFDLDDQVRRLTASPFAGWPRSQDDWKALRQAVCPEVPLRESEPITGFDPDDFMRDLVAGSWLAAPPDSVERLYATTFSASGPGNRRFANRREHRTFLTDLQRAFPDLHPDVDEVYWMGNDDDGYLISTRWSAEAVHAGDGLYGRPSGATLQIWGITQTEVRGGQVQREWTLYNELDLLMQIEKARQTH